MIKILIYGPEEIQMNPDANGTKPLGSAIITQLAPWSEEDFIQTLASTKADIIMGWGDAVPSFLSNSPHEFRKKWYHFDHRPDYDELRNAATGTYHMGMLRKHMYQDDNPYVSICTPTYNTGVMLHETYFFIKNQTHRNWEWIIVDDGSTDDTLMYAREIAKQDPRVKVFAFDHVGRIGFLKRAACCMATGEFIVELDHDDIITENCLAEVVQAFRENPDAGMVYSNCAEWLQPVNQNGEKIPWNSSSNDRWNMYQADYWFYRDTFWGGKMCKEALQWDVNGIYSFEVENGFRVIRPVIMVMPICPNHVRAFRSSVYHEVGCHRDLVYADDYDLMLRIFIHSKIVHIEKLLYIQRMHNNTWIHFNDYLVPMFDTLEKYYSDALINKLSKMGVMSNDGGIAIPKSLVRPDGSIEVFERVHDGTGLRSTIRPARGAAEVIYHPTKVSSPGINVILGSNTQQEEIVTVDIKTGGSICHNLNDFPWPFEENSIEKIVANGILEHLVDTVSVMNECYRVLKPGGVLEIEVPTTDGHGAFSNPDHKSFWNEDTIKYFCPLIDPVVYGFGQRMGVNTNFRLLHGEKINIRENVQCLRLILNAEK